MQLLQTLRVGIYSLLLHKLRSALAILGIFIGITAVIWLVALGEGVSHQAQQQIKDLGASNIIIRSIKPPMSSSKGGRRSMFVSYGVLRADFDRIQTLPDISQSVPMREIRREFRNVEWYMEGRLVGCSPQYREMNHLTMERGRFLSDKDSDPPTNVCVIADEIAKKLFPGRNPIGQSLQIEKEFYKIVGQTASREASAAIGGSLAAQEYNQDVYIPLTTLRARIGDMVFTSRSGSREGEVVELSQITVTVGSIEAVDDAAGVIEHLLAKYHKNKDYSIVVPKELLRQAELLRLMFNLLMFVIAGISLLVGGIGIMNIMLATVTERTREIGIRRALGACRSDIIRQFLVEAIALTGLGGILGVVLGLLCKPCVDFIKWVLTKFMAEAMSAVPKNILDLEPRLNWISVASAFGISVVVGLAFGIYPAIRAAYMDPIEALRHE